MALSARLRFEILRRDNYACRYCGAKAPFAVLHVDHVIPRRHGGTDAPWNLTAACADCNLGKSDGVPDQTIIHEVRQDHVLHMKCKGLPVLPCMYCSTPVQREPEDESDEHPQCLTCNAAVCDAYDAGFSRALGRR